MTFWLCVGAVITPVQSSAQQPTVPVAQATDPDQPVTPTPAPTVPADDQSQPATTPKPAPVAINPKTGLPYTAQELREKGNRQVRSPQARYRPVRACAARLPCLSPTANSLTPSRTRPAKQRPFPAPSPRPIRQLPPRPAQKKSQGSAGGGQGGSQASTQDSDTSGEGDSGYSGPAVLTRSYISLSRPMEATPIKWAGSLGFSYSWTDGQAPAVVNGVSGFVSAKSSSAALNWNLGGRHRWKRDQIGLSYTGNTSKYWAQNQFSNLSGVNNSLNLDYSHIFSRRFQFHLVESGQELSQNYPLENPALQPGSSVANINLATSPSIQLLNNKVRQSSTQAGVTYRQTARLSYDGSATYFIIWRDCARTHRHAGRAGQRRPELPLDQTNHRRRLLFWSPTTITRTIFRMPLRMGWA